MRRARSISEVTSSCEIMKWCILQRWWDIIKSGMHARFVTTKERKGTYFSMVFSRKGQVRKESSRKSPILCLMKKVCNNKDKRNVLSLVEHKFDWSKFTHSVPVFHFLTSWKRLKTRVFLKFLRGYRNVALVRNGLITFQDSLGVGKRHLEENTVFKNKQH